MKFRSLVCSLAFLYGSTVLASDDLGEAAAAAGRIVHAISSADAAYYGASAGDLRGIFTAHDDNAANIAVLQGLNGQKATLVRALQALGSLSARDDFPFEILGDIDALQAYVAQPPVEPAQVAPEVRAPAHIPEIITQYNEIVPNAMEAFNVILQQLKPNAQQSFLRNFNGEISADSISRIIFNQDALDGLASFIHTFESVFNDVITGKKVPRSEDQQMTDALVQSILPNIERFFIFIEAFRMEATPLLQTLKSIAQINIASHLLTEERLTSILDTLSSAFNNPILQLMPAELKTIATIDIKRVTHSLLAACLDNSIDAREVSALLDRLNSDTPVVPAVRLPAAEAAAADQVVPAAPARAADLSPGEKLLLDYSARVEEAPTMLAVSAIVRELRALNNPALAGVMDAANDKLDRLSKSKATAPVADAAIANEGKKPKAPAAPRATEEQARAWAQQLIHSAWEVIIDAACIGSNSPDDIVAEDLSGLVDHVYRISAEDAKIFEAAGQTVHKNQMEELVSFTAQIRKTAIGYLKGAGLSDADIAIELAEFEKMGLLFNETLSESRGGAGPARFRWPEVRPLKLYLHADGLLRDYHPSEEQPQAGSAASAKPRRPAGGIKING